MISYAISDPQTLSFDRLEEDLQRFASRADWFLYRDKGHPRYRARARKLAEELDNSFPLKFFLHDDIVLAQELGADGVHLSGRGSNALPQAKAAGLFTIVSTHSIEEAEFLIGLGADAVTLSPIFASPGKGKPLGIAYLQEAVACLKAPVIALGGIVGARQIDAVETVGAFGFASIRYFAPDAEETCDGIS
jgi:thiamine-phosphate pyrophosphorylase